MPEIDLLLENANLRDQMEPYLDESVTLVDLDRMSVSRENEFLTSLLAWETTAPPNHRPIVRKKHLVDTHRSSIRSPTLLLDSSRHSSGRRKEGLA